MSQNQRNHLFLINPAGESRVFNHARGMDDSSDEEGEGADYRAQKTRFRSNFQVYQDEVKIRHEARSLVPFVEKHIDYIEISFLKIFDSSLEAYFNRNYGLKVVGFTQFNQKVLFAISDEKRFKENFLEGLQAYYNAPNNEVPDKCKVLTLIHEFVCHTTARMKQMNVTTNIIIHLIDNLRISNNDFSIINNSMHDFLNNMSVEFYSIGGNELLLQIPSIESNILDQLLDNFDIIQQVQGLRTMRVQPNVFGDMTLQLGLDVNITGASVVIGVIDTGVSSIKPLDNLIVGPGIDTTDVDNPKPYEVTCDHGTTVATLASFGWDFFHREEGELHADAKIFSIKVQDGETGLVNVYKISEAIKRAYLEFNIKIFNLSLNIGGKNYNTSISDYAYILDRLAYDYNLLIFISTGNLGINDIRAIEERRNDVNVPVSEREFLKYPNHFYDPSKMTDVHCCECTNLCEPAESMNNITVGALANNLNFEAEDQTNLTLGPHYPAYYTRKYYIDYNQKIINTRFKKNQINPHIFKPDIVMPGGDLLASKSKMNVIGLNGGQPWYVRSAGTSLATPLAANVAAKILNKYPNLNMQSVKAILINSTDEIKSAYLEDLIRKLKAEYLHDNYPEIDSDNVPLKIKRELSQKYNADRLNKCLVGHGIPNLDKCLYSSEKFVVLVVEDVVYYDSYKVINLRVPSYLYKHPKNVAVTISATLCYKFDPIFNNPLSYNPVHISFNIGNSVEKNDPQENARFYATSTKSHDNSQIAIKSSFSSWSDDFFPASSKIFSNTQKFSININASELLKIQGEMSIIVRATGRPDGMFEAQVQKAHPFSLVISLEEKECETLGNEDLYSNMQLINDLLIIGEVEGHADVG